MRVVADSPAPVWYFFDDKNRRLTPTASEALTAAAGDGIAVSTALLTTSEAVMLGVAGLGAAIAVAAEPPGWLNYLGAGLSGAARLPVPAIQRLYHRLFRRDLWSLTKVRSLAVAMPDVGPKLQSLCARPRRAADHFRLTHG